MVDNEYEKNKDKYSHKIKKFFKGVVNKEINVEKEKKKIHDR